MSKDRWVIVITGLILAVLLGQCDGARAADNQGGFRGGLIIGSYHWDDYDGYNEKQNGLYLCYKRVCGGGYDNSYYEKSIFLMYEHYLGAAGPIDFTGVVGVVDGYKGYDTTSEWMPFAGLTVRIGILKLWQVGTATAYGLEIPTGRKAK